jgi:CBS domain-containing protein
MALRAMNGRKTPMKVDDLSNPLDVVAAPEETLANAASRMRYNDVGCVPVLSHGQLVGILTERDLSRAVADGADPDRTSVGDYMASDPIVIASGSDARDAARVMVEAGVRHLPIVRDGRLLGVMSMRDIVAELLWSGEWKAS